MKSDFVIFELKKEKKNKFKYTLTFYTLLYNSNEYLISRVKFKIVSRYKRRQFARAYFMNTISEFFIPNDEEIHSFRVIRTAINRIN